MAPQSIMIEKGSRDRTVHPVAEAESEREEGAKNKIHLSETGSVSLARPS